MSTRRGEESEQCEGMKYPRCDVVFYPNPPGPGARDETKDNQDNEAQGTNRHYWMYNRKRHEDEGCSHGADVLDE